MNQNYHSFRQVSAPTLDFSKSYSETMRHHRASVTPTGRRLFLSVISGLLSGAIASIFLRALAAVTAFRLSHPPTVFLLPFFGLVVGGLYERFAKRAARGTDLILDEIHRPTNRTPGRMTPLVLFGSLLSHLGGASTGREGVAVQMGASLSDQLSRFLKLSDQDRRLLLMTGSAGGFAAALGAPFAGMIFGMEVLTKKLRFRVEYPMECAISAWVAYFMTDLCRAAHTHYGPIPLDFATPGTVFGGLIGAAALGAVTGVAIRIFFLLTDSCTDLFKGAFQSLGARAFAGGLVVLGLGALVGNRLSLGLGIESIQAAFHHSSPVFLPFEKILFTSVSLGAGFKGGEFIPLVFIGSTLTSSLSPLLAVGGFALPTAFSAGIGLVASYGAAARVPLALAVFAAEQFSIVFFPFALVACVVALTVAGRHSSVFSSQID